MLLARRALSMVKGAAFSRTPCSISGSLQRAAGAAESAKLGGGSSARAVSRYLRRRRRHEHVIKEGWVRGNEERSQLRRRLARGGEEDHRHALGGSPLLYSLLSPLLSSPLSLSSLLSPLSLSLSLPPSLPPSAPPTLPTCQPPTLGLRSSETQTLNHYLLFMNHGRSVAGPKLERIDG